ncbi:S41 family peptidase [Lishizhenia sp.]|uniref:S41 family peptidase n=1 Tax=Lishizhenia sp. TaxID=2497594 RepID=UPI00299E9CF2|nr:S41 family peptidase [Lishizhenia sp.]MDX1446155.1 S41 family peptidase [Lishizhenia sp.]
MKIKYKILAGAFLFTTGFTFAQEGNSTQQNAVKLGEVFNYVDRYYVEEVDGDKIADDAIRNMLEQLDPHSTYIPKEKVQSANQSINGSFVGIGVQFQILKDTLIVVNPIPTGPSEKVGIQAGDKIIFIDGENVAGVGLQNAGVRDRLLGDKDTKVKVEVKRGDDEKLINFTITRDNIPVNSVVAKYMLSKKVGYIKLTSFSRTSSQEIKDALEELKKEGMKDLVLDLQGNGGGLLYAAKLIADEFLKDDKLIVYSEGRAQPRQEFVADTKGDFEKGRLVILTDEGTASASEIVSGAIQDWDRGLIVGRRTFGKGLVQRPIELNDGAQIRLTIARYFTPSGRFIQKPYDDLEAYKNDYYERYMHGEMMNQDSIKLADSLKYSTLITKRTVYGGGGIMPDVFVPLDTSEYSDYYRALSRSGVINSFCLEYVNTNRESLKRKYEDVDAFDADFNLNEEFMDNFFTYVVGENEDLEFIQEDYDISKALLQIRLKAAIAQNLWGYNAFYKIYNQKNEILNKAIAILAGDIYNNVELAKQ